MAYNDGMNNSNTVNNLLDIEKVPARLNKGALDDYFVEYYIDTANITDSYEMAANKAGHAYNKEYARQYGHKMYKRLQTKINDAITTAEIDDHILGRKVQRELALNAESESTRLLAANALVRKKTDKLEIIKDELTSIDRREAIAMLQDRLKIINPIEPDTD